MYKQLVAQQRNNHNNFRANYKLNFKNLIEKALKIDLIPLLFILVISIGLCTFRILSHQGSVPSLIIHYTLHAIWYYAIFGVVIFSVVTFRKSYQNKSLPKFNPSSVDAYSIDISNSPLYYTVKDVLYSLCKKTEIPIKILHLDVTMDSSINALCFGNLHRDMKGNFLGSAHIVVTQGLLQNTSRNELRAVLAYEFWNILSGSVQSESLNSKILEHDINKENLYASVYAYFFNRDSLLQNNNNSNIPLLDPNYDLPNSDTIIKKANEFESKCDKSGPLNSLPLFVKAKLGRATNKYYQDLNRLSPAYQQNTYNNDVGSIYLTHSPHDLISVLSKINSYSNLMEYPRLSLSGQYFVDPISSSNRNQPPIESRIKYLKQCYL